MGHLVQLNEHKAATNFRKTALSCEGRYTNMAINPCSFVTREGTSDSETHGDILERFLFQYVVYENVPSVRIGFSCTTIHAVIQKVYT